MIGGEGGCNITGTVFVAANGTVLISGNVMIGNLQVEGKLVVLAGDSLEVTETLSLADSSSLEVSKSENADGSTSIVVRKLECAGGISLTLVFQVFVTREQRLREGRTDEVVTVNVQETEAPLPADSVAVVVPVVTYEEVSGEFESAVVGAGEYPGSECDVYSSEPSVVYGSNTLSVATSVGRDTSIPGCELPGGGLSTGAIVGIVVGSVIGFVILFTLVLVFFRRKELASKSATFKRSLRDREGTSHMSSTQSVGESRI